MTCLDIISDSTGKEIVAAIKSTDVAQARISEINQAAESKKNEVLASIPEDYRNTVEEVNQLKGDIEALQDDKIYEKVLLPRNAFTVIEDYYIGSDGTAVYPSNLYSTFCYKAEKEQEISILANKDGSGKYELFRVCICDKDLTKLETATQAEMQIIENNNTECRAIVSAGQYLAFTVFCYSVDTPDTVFPHIEVRATGERYTMPNVIINAEQIIGVDSEIKTYRIEKTVTSDTIILSEADPIIISGELSGATIHRRNRFNIDNAVFSTSKVVPVKENNGITMHCDPSDTNKDVFTRTNYTAEISGMLFVSCLAECEGSAEDLAMHVWYQGAAQTVARGNGRIYTALYVEKGTDVWIDFYCAYYTKHGNTTRYRDIMFSFGGLYDYTKYNDDGLEYECRQGDILVFESDTTITYSYLPSKKKYNVVCFGDSITGMARNRQAYPDMIDMWDNDYNVINVGFSGSSLTDTTDATLNPFCFNNLVDAVVSGDFTSQSASKRVNPTESAWYSKTFDEHLSVLKDIDFNKVDFVTIFFGTNDWGNNAVLESKDDAMHSRKVNVEDALKYCIEQLAENFPKLRILVITPYWRDMGNNGTDSNEIPNAKGNFIYEYSDKLTDWAKEYNLPVVSLYRSCGVNKYNHKLFLVDGTHPNQVMSRLIAKRIEHAMDEYGT